MCQRCKIKFFTPRQLTNDPKEAEAYLWGRFVEHKWPFVIFASPFRKKAVNQ